MVNRIDGNQYTDYTQKKTVNNIQDNGEKFSLNYKQENLQSEEPEKKDKTSETGKAKTRTMKKSGVMLELSQNGQQAGAKEEQEEAEVKAQSQMAVTSFLDTLREFVSDLIRNVKAFFYRIWNDEETETGNDEESAAEQTAEAETEHPETERDIADTSEFSEILQDAETIQRNHEARIDKEIRQYLHTGDLPQVISILTDNGKKTIAKNSTLLTYYDRNGRVVEPNASDRERILHGDRGSRSL